MRDYSTLFKRFMITILVVIIIRPAANAQFENEGRIAIPSPQVWSFMKYGNNPINLYTGTASVSIPIYTYKDNDFELPISIDYSSNGYMPNIQTGILGLGWFLNAGGCITREVKCLPDDKISYLPFLAGGSAEFYGYLWYHRTTNTPNWDEHFNINMFKDGYAIPCFKLNDKRVETESDIYHFKFGLHNGYFSLGLNKTIYVYNTSIPASEYKIDISKLDSEKVINITTGDGFQYLFGGAFQT